MGNHEYCVDCGESDFHHGSPCNPLSKAKQDARKAKIEQRRLDRVAKIKSDEIAFVRMGYETTIDEEHGSVKLRPIE